MKETLYFSTKVSLIALTALFISCKNEKKSNGSPTTPTTGELESTSRYIIGGQETQDNTPISQRTVAILNSSNKMRCSSTLITRNIVLTAAHCFGDGTNNNDLSVSFGTKVGSGETRKVTKLVTNSQYRSGAALGESAPLYDVALVQFQPEAPAQAATAVVPDMQLQLTGGMPFSVAGFGWAWSNPSALLSKGGGEGTLREVTLVLTSVLENSMQLKFVSPSKAVCSGDSGGPAYVVQNGTYYVAGVTSWGYSRCENGLSVFSDVRKFRSWIAEKAAALGSPIGAAGGGGGGGSYPTPAPVPTVVPVNPAINGGPVTVQDQRILQEAQSIYGNIQAGFINQQVKEIAYKNQPKYDRRSWMLFKNTAPQYRCVNIKGTGEPWGINWGMTNGPFVYYNNIRISSSPTYDAVNCMMAATWSRAHWYLDN